MMRAIPQSASSATRFRGNRTFQFPLYWAISAFQLAAKMGFRTVAIGGGGDKDDLARKLGAEHYIDTGAEDRSPPCKHSVAPGRFSPRCRVERLSRH
jgi:hypothetical protein